VTSKRVTEAQPYNTRLLLSVLAPKGSALSFQASACILPGSRNANRYDATQFLETVSNRAPRLSFPFLSDFLPCRAQPDSPIFP